MKHCMYCNTLIAKDAEFCPKCGKKQKNTNSNIHIDGTSNNDVNSNSFFSSWIDFWKRYSHGHGFSSRSQYWKMMLINLIIFIIYFIYRSLLVFINIPFVVNNFIFLYNLPVYLLLIYGLIALVPSVSLNCRRLRDAGLSNGEVITLIICNFIPFINIISAIINFVCVLMPTSQNRKR